MRDGGEGFGKDNTLRERQREWYEGLGENREESREREKREGMGRVYHPNLSHAALRCNLMISATFTKWLVSIIFLILPILWMFDSLNTGFKCFTWPDFLLHFSAIMSGQWPNATINNLH